MQLELAVIYHVLLSFVERLSTPAGPHPHRLSILGATGGSRCGLKKVGCVSLNCSSTVRAPRDLRRPQESRFRSPVAVQVEVKGRQEGVKARVTT